MDITDVGIDVSCVRMRNWDNVPVTFRPVIAFILLTFNPHFYLKIAVY
jgi:hypothetical protein